MAAKRGGLGRNLTALLGQGNNPLMIDTPPVSHPVKINVECLQPGKYQPRGVIEDKPLEELASSIKQQGVLQPLIVRELSDGRYEIIAGERRWRASKLAGLKEVPVILKQVDDETAMAMALIENLQREDLNAMDQSKAMGRLVSEFNLTHQQIAELLGKSRTAVSNFLRLLSLSEEVKRLLEHGDIDMGHARAMLLLDEQQQHQVATIIIAKQLSVRETEKLVARIKEGKSTASVESKPEIQPVFNEKVQDLAKQLQAKVKLKPAKSGKGQLIIHYENLNNLESILSLIYSPQR